MPYPPGVEVRRSRRRTRTVAAWREDGLTIVAIPARFTRAQEAEWVSTMLGRLAAQDTRRRPSDALLMRRATELSHQYLDGRAVPASVEWSSRQGKRWGSCTVTDRSIRISAALQGMPRWVLDYVLIHELVHLLHAGHGPRFWSLVAAYPHADRARGFLDGYAYARGRTDARRGDEPGDDEPGGDGPVDDEPGDDEPGAPGGDLDPADDAPVPVSSSVSSGLLF